MPKSKVDKSRKQKVQDYKQVKQIEKQIAKSMSIEKQAPQQQTEGLPAVRHVPFWSSKEQLEVLGIEFEAMNNFIVQAQNAIYATNSVMNRNILNGKVKVRFEKLDESGQNYVPMTADEEVPYQKDFQDMVNAVRERESGSNQSADPTPESPTASETLVVSLVSAEGEPISSQ